MGSEVCDVSKILQFLGDISHPLPRTCVYSRDGPPRMIFGFTCRLVVHIEYVLKFGSIRDVYFQIICCWD